MIADLLDDLIQVFGGHLDYRTEELQKKILKEVEGLQNSAETLDALRACGVDNWCG